MNETRPLTPRDVWLGRIEAENHARTVELARASRERRLTRFTPTSIPDPDDEIVEWNGFEAWAGEEDDEIVPEPIPDDPAEPDPAERSEQPGDPLLDLDEDEAWEIASLADDPDEILDPFATEAEVDELLDDPNENGELSQSRPLPWKRWSGYTVKHANRRHRKSWMRYPHRHHFHGVTEADIAVEAAFLDGYRDGIERKLAEQGIHDVKVVVIPHQRAA